jgi:hypothetical protein
MASYFMLIHERCCIVKDKVLLKNLPEGTEENEEKHQSGLLVSEPRFEPKTSGIRA